MTTLHALLANPLVLTLGLLLTTLVALFAVRLARALAASGDADGIWPFAVRKPLKRVEQILFYRLVQTLPDQIVLGQVALSRFLTVRKGRTWSVWHDRICRESIDYLVCERDFTIVAAIELDDRSHDTLVRSKSDALKARALAAAGVPLVRWRVTALPDVETIRTVIEDIRRERIGDLDAVTAARVAPDLNVTGIEASNDATMFNAETRR